MSSARYLLAISSVTGSSHRPSSASGTNNGQIVHASTQRTGIKITAATYREILAVRRIV